MRRLLPLIAALALALTAPAAQAAPPTIESTSFSEAGTEAVTLEAQINPQNKTTSYRFEYGPADCSANPCVSVPVPEGKLTAGSQAVAVSERIEGLTPGAIYHFRVIAHSSGTGGGEAISPDATFATYLLPPVFGPCPNDFLRTENPAAARIEHSSANLPDCRAYEQATPVDKGGGDVTGTVPLVRAALEGNAISFVSNSGVPGGLGSQELPSYLATRGAGEWSTTGILPPADTGQEAEVLGWTPDFSAIFTSATKLGEPLKTAFLMTPKGGAPLEIVAHTANLETKLAAATDDAAQVLFESKTALPDVPGALEGSSNLYLWERASEQIGLAGVMNDGEAPSDGAFAGPYDWTRGTNPQTLGQGGAARDYYTQEEHVLSEDGDAVYFTAARSGKLYLRKNPGEEQSPVVLSEGKEECTDPQLACTIEVSATQKKDGQGPGGADAAGTRPAAFMGASKDGSLSFFTSNEKLTDDANTGPEPEPAAIERSGLEGEGIEPSFIPKKALGVAVDSGHVYWTNPDDGTIGRAKLNGEDPEPGLIVPGPVEVEAEVEPGVIETVTAPSTPRYVTVGPCAEGGQCVYWTNTGALNAHDVPAENGGTIGRAVLDGEGELVSESIDPEFITGASAPEGVAVNATHIYWVNNLNNPNFEGTPGWGYRESVGRADLGGGEIDQTLTEMEGGTIGIQVTGIALDAEHVYWIRSAEGQLQNLLRADLNGGNRENLYLGFDNGPSAAGLAVAAGHAYFAIPEDHAIGRAELGPDFHTASFDKAFLSTQGAPLGVAVDSEHIYWSVNGETPSNPGNDLYRYDAASGELRDISVDSASPAGAEVRGVLGASADGSHVYYAANGVPDGTLDSPNARGEEAQAGDCPAKLSQTGTAGTCNLYLWEEGATPAEGTTRFIARLEVGGVELANDVTNWDASAASWIFASSNFEKTALVSPDGQTLLFRSKRPLSGYQDKGTPQIYRYRAGDAGPTCVSCNPTGEAPLLPGLGGGPSLGSIFPSVVIPPNPAPTLAHNLSEDGNRVFFETLDPLVAEDVNGQGGCPFVGSDLQNLRGCLDVYEWEAQGTGSCGAGRAVAEGGCLYLLSGGEDTGPALIADASADGKDVFFYTRPRLVGADEDQLLDIYDARIEGGLAAQNQPPPPIPCEADGCKPAPTSGPTIAPPPSFSGPGDPKPRRCKKGRRPRAGRCVAKRRHRAKHHRKRRKEHSGARRSGR